MITSTELESSAWTSLSLRNKINRVNQEIETKEGETDITFETYINNFSNKRRMIMSQQKYRQEINQQNIHQKGDIIFILFD